MKFLLKTFFKQYQKRIIYRSEEECLSNDLFHRGMKQNMRNRLNFFSNGLSNWLGRQNTPTAYLQRGKAPPHNVCAGYDTKQSDDEVPVMLELWGMRSTSSLPLLPGPLWSRVGGYPSVVKQSVYFTAPADWATIPGFLMPNPIHTYISNKRFINTFC